MNGTTTPTTGRSVQLAVMAAPTTSVVQAVAEARRRHDASGRWIPSAGAVRTGQPAAAAA